jgi:RNA polymerase-binding protein
MSVRTVPDTRPGQRHYRPEVPAPRQQAAYRCDRGHRFTVTFAADVQSPEAVDCRCGAGAHHAESTNVMTTESANVVIVDSDHQRRMVQLRGRRTPAELEQILADRLAELAAMRETGRTGP